MTGARAGQAGRGEPEPAAAAVQRDARDFVGAVVQRLREIERQAGRPGLVVAAFDTELFGHWWYEGPQFLAAVLRMLPQAGVRLNTLAGAREAGLVAGRVELPESSWGAGKDWQVWDNDAVGELNDELVSIQKRLFAVLDERSRLDGVRGGRDPAADQLVREAMLASSSDWAFMITRDTAAGYAWQRAAQPRRAVLRAGRRAAGRRPRRCRDRAGGRAAPAGRAVRPAGRPDLLSTCHFVGSRSGLASWLGMLRDP